MRFLYRKISTHATFAITFQAPQAPHFRTVFIRLIRNMRKIRHKQFEPASLIIPFATGYYQSKEQQGLEHREPTGLLNPLNPFQKIRWHLYTAAACNAQILQNPSAKGL